MGHTKLSSVCQALFTCVGGREKLKAVSHSPWHFGSSSSKLTCTESPTRCHIPALCRSLPTKSSLPSLSRWTTTSLPASLPSMSQTQARRVGGAGEVPVRCMHARRQTNASHFGPAMPSLCLAYFLWLVSEGIHDPQAHMHYAALQNLANFMVHEAHPPAWLASQPAGRAVPPRACSQLFGQGH
jgi:hypothetical protein